MRDVMMVGRLPPCFVSSALTTLQLSFLTSALCGLFGHADRPGGLSPAASGIKNLDADYRHRRQLLPLETCSTCCLAAACASFSAPESLSITLRAFGDVIITNVAWIVPLITVPAAAGDPLVAVPHPLRDGDPARWPRR